MQRLSATAVEIDLREMTISHDEQNLSPEPYGADQIVQHVVEVRLEGSKIAYMMFTEMHNALYGRVMSDVEDEELANSIIPQILYVDSVDVDREYRNLGIGTMLYKEFGKIYDSKFSGWPVGRYFLNPIAEYAFRKAVGLGWVSETTLTEDYIERGPRYRHTDVVKDLRNKLPEHVKGPEVWATRDLRKIIASPDVTFEVIENWGKENGDDVHLIRAHSNNMIVGLLQFQSNTDEQRLSIAEVEVNSNVRNLGIGELLYKEFGDLYSSKYNGWDVVRFFTNPVAEYTFRKAVSKGYVPQKALQEHNIMRDYDGSEDLVVDLRNKLPENFRGPNVWAKVAATDTLVDLRHIEISVKEGEDFYGAEADSGLNIEIKASINGEDAGLLEFSAYENVQPDTIHSTLNKFRSAGKVEKLLFVHEIWVPTQYRNLGIGLLLYKKFGEIYNSRFNGWPVARYYVNQIAEYSFRKAVGLGYINEVALDDKYVTRDVWENAETNGGDIWKDLRNKLPENVKGPEVWAHKEGK